MRATYKALLLLAFGCATSNAPEEQERAAPTPHAEAAESPAESPESPETAESPEALDRDEALAAAVAEWRRENPEGPRNRAALGAFISIGDPVMGFSPGLLSRLYSGDEPRLFVTPNMSASTPRGYSIEMQVPAAAPEGPVSAESLHVSVSDQGGVASAVRGTVTFRALDFDSGQVGLVVEGETLDDPTRSVSVEIDARLRVE